MAVKKKRDASLPVLTFTGCRNCNGAGTEPDTCQLCCGKGCHFCRGTGMRLVPCSVCKGAGMVEMEQMPLFSPSRSEDIPPAGKP